RVAVAPGVAREHPADLEPGPALGLPQPAAPDEPAAGALHDRRLAPPAELAVADEQRDLAPRRRAAGRAAAHVTHHLRVGDDRGIGVEVVRVPAAQLEPLRDELGHADIIPP